MDNPQLFDCDEFREGDDARHYTTQITLRDLFAGMALHGLCVDQHKIEGYTLDELAFDSYRISDAMLKIRDGGASDG